MRKRQDPSAWRRKTTAARTLRVFVLPSGAVLYSVCSTVFSAMSSTRLWLISAISHRPRDPRK